MIKNVLKVGNSLGVTFPKSFVDEHNIKQGDKVAITQQNGVITYSPKLEEKPKTKISAEFNKWLNMALDKDREILNELA